MYCECKSIAIELVLLCVIILSVRRLYVLLLRLAISNVKGKMKKKTSFKFSSKLLFVLVKEITRHDDVG